MFIQLLAKKSKADSIDNDDYFKEQCLFCAKICEPVNPKDSER
jgi:hypothetical protein